MGNGDLRDIASISKVEQNSIGGETVAVDASHWLYRYMTTTTRFTDSSDYTTSDGIELPNLIGVPRGIRKFYEYDVNPVFVFDGNPHQLKSEELERRKSARNKAAKKAEKSDDSIETAKYKSRSQKLNDEIISTTKDILDLLSVPYTTAPQAAESQAAYMSNTDAFDAVVTGDYDSLIFGASRTIRKFTTSANTIEIMSLDETLESNNITYEQLVLATILCGSDYNDGVSGVGPKTSISLVQENPTIDELRSELDEPLKKAEEIYKLYTDSITTDDWPTPEHSLPDTEGVESYLNDKGLSTDKISKALDDINENQSQLNIDSF